MSFVKRVERVALAVENLDEARTFFEKTFDAKFAPLEVIEDMNMRYQAFMVGESRMELLDDNRIALISLTPESFERTGAGPYETENIIDETSRIGSVRASALLRNSFRAH